MRQRFSDTPAMFIQSSGNRVSLDAGPARPVCYTQSFSVVGQVSGMARVQRLLPWCSPPAIARFIVTIVVNTVNRVFWGRLWSHVLVKVEKGSHPTVADSNSASSVVAVTRKLLVGASLDHARPSAVFGGIVQVVRRVSGTTARLMVSVAKHCAAYVHFFSAFASAEPASAVAMNTNERHHRQFSIDVASLVFDSMRQLGRLVRRHDSTPIKLDCERAESVNHDRLGSFHCATHGSVVQ